MSGTHDHSHGSSRISPKALSRLRIALVITSIYMVAEAVGGWWTNSLALLADAGHMLTDVGALALSLAAFSIASRPATPQKTYGYYRLEVIAALVNGVVLIVLAFYIVWEAIGRFRSPAEVAGLEMTGIAAGGLIVNIIAAYLLHAEHEHNLNLRGAWLHVMGDMLGSVAAISAGVLILAFGFLWADALTSVIISGIIIFNASRLLRDSVDVLLESTPKHIDLTEVETAIAERSAVLNVHDLHVWTISSGIEALSAHVAHDRSIPETDLLLEIRDLLQERFGISHLTIQLETADHSTDKVFICAMGGNCFESAASADR